MSQQIQITGGAKVRDLQDVIIGTSGVLSSLAFNVANGVPKLDSNGKILVAQLPNSVMEYLGVWNAATNTPTLANGTGNQGDVYLCNVAGTVDFGAGPIVFFVGDQVIYSGSIWQRASGATGTVTSVGITESGDSLNITGSPITTSGTINIGFNGTNLQYVNGAGNLTTFPDLTGFVPYTGATGAVNLGAFDLTVNGITVGKGAGTGANNMAIGSSALANNTTGASNTAVGTSSLQSNTTGGNNTSIGADSLSSVTTGINNTAIGYVSGSSITTGSNNTILGNYDGTPTIANNIILADGNGNIKYQWDGINNNLYGKVNFSSTIGNGTYTYTLPSATGTLALTSDIPILTGYVPYTGATANVDLGTFNLTADVITGATGSFASSGGSDTFAINHSSGAGIALNITKGGNGEGLYINKTSGSGNAATIIGTLNATTLVKSGGTSSQFLKADGTVDSTAYQSALTLTTTGTSGAATLVGATLNIPQYQAAGTYVTSVTASAPLSSSGSTNPNITITQVSSTVDGYLSFSDYNVFTGKISGSGTAGYITRYTGSGSTIGNSGLYDDGTTVSLISRALSGSSASFSVSSGTVLNVAGNAIFRGDTGVGTPRQLIITSGGSTPVYLEAKGYGANYQTDFGIRTYNNVGTAFEVFYADSSGRVGINQVSPAYQLDVNGTGRFSGSVTSDDVIFTAGTLFGTGNTGFSNRASDTTLYLQMPATGFNITDNALNTKFILSSTGAATFSSNVGIKISGRSESLAIEHTTGNVSAAFFYTSGVTTGQSYGLTVHAGTNSSDRSFLVSNQGGGTEYFKIRGDGAATFSSSVTAQLLAISNGYYLVGRNAANTAFRTLLTFDSSNKIIIGQDSDITSVTIGVSTANLTIASTGAATFSSSVGIGASPASLLYAYSSTSTAEFRLERGGVGDVGARWKRNGSDLGYISNADWIIAGTSSTDFGVTAVNNLIFGTASTERMRITSDGNLLLGTTDNGSGAKLVFFSTTAAQQLKAAGTAPAITFSNTITSPTIGGSLGACTSAGQFLSGTAAGDLILINQFTGNKLYITNYSGGVYLTQGATSWTANSDIRLKNINSHIENAVEKLSTLQTINFSYKDDKFKKQNLGLIAQEVQKIFPELIDKNGDGMLGVRYTELVPVLIKAVQELKAEIETLKNK